MSGLVFPEPLTSAASLLVTEDRTMVTGEQMSDAVTLACTVTHLWVGGQIIVGFDKKAISEELEI